MSRDQSGPFDKKVASTVKVDAYDTESDSFNEASGSNLNGEQNNYGSTNEIEPDDLDGYALPRPQLYRVVGGLCMCAFLAALDATVVSALLTIIASDLNALGSMSWIATAYLLSCSALQPIYGKLSDIFGRKSLLIFCCITFAVGCAICSLSTMILVVAGRFIAGIGGAGLTTLSTITLSDLIPLRDRGIYQGYTNVFYGLGVASGGIIGGSISDWLGWRYVFLLQVPLACFVALIIQWNLQFPKNSPGLGSTGHLREKFQRIDILGSISLVSFLICVLTAASEGQFSPIFIGSAICSVISLSLFMYVEFKIAVEPILPIFLLAKRAVIASCLTNWFYTMGVFTYLFYVPVYYTSVMSLPGSQVGLRLIPNFFGTSVGSVGAGLYMKRTGKYYQLAIYSGILALIGISNIVSINPDINVWRQFTLLLPSGLAYSSILTITLLSLISAVPSSHQAGTTSISYMFRSTGSALGVSIASGIFKTGLRTHLEKSVPRLVDDPHLAKSIITKTMQRADYILEAPEFIQDTLRLCYHDACKASLYFAFACICLGATFSVFMRDNHLHVNVNRE